MATQTPPARPLEIATYEPLEIAGYEPLPKAPRTLEGFGRNTLASGKDLITDTWQALSHPITTGKTMLDIATGLMSKLTPGGAQPALEGQASKADAMVQYFTERYGSVEGLQEAAYTDPVGVLADVSTVLTTGGGAAARVGRLTRLGNRVVRAGELVRDAGSAIDPMRAATAIARPALEAAGTGIVEATVRPPAAVKRQQHGRFETSRTIREQRLLSEAGAADRGAQVSAQAERVAQQIPSPPIPTRPMINAAYADSAREAARRTGHVVESENAAVDELARIERDVPATITPAEALRLRQNSDRLSTQFYKHQDALLPTSPVGMQATAQASWGNQNRNLLRQLSPELGDLSDLRRRLMLSEAALETAGDRPHALTRMLGAGAAGLGNPAAGAGMWAMDSPLVGTSVAAVMDALAQMLANPETRMQLNLGRLTQAGTSGAPLPGVR